jgi:putative addiction module killer protein
MFTLHETEVFAAWMDNLKDGRARARIAQRLDRLARGNPGDVKPVGKGISELRIDHGPGYRVYYLQCGTMLIVLLCGGDKGSQNKDIGRAKQLAEELKEQKDGSKNPPL